MRQNLHIKVLAIMDSKIKNTFGDSKAKLAPKTLLEVAKQLGFIEGVRGPAGGYMVTDKGLEYIGFNVEEFTAKESKQKMVDLDEVRRKQKEASQARAEELAQLINKAQRELVVSEGLRKNNKVESRS